MPTAAAVTHQWISAIAASGATTLSQPAFTDISGSVAASQMPAFTGDITTSAGAVATTLATVNSNVGTFGSASLIPVVTVNGKGLITAVSTASATASVAHQGKMTVFTSSGTFTTQSDSSVATIYEYLVIGAGGGGGGSNGASSSGGGGGAGGISQGTFTGVAASTGITITVSSSGGTSGASSGGTGGTGGTSTIGTPVSASAVGGSGGVGSTSGNAAGGAGGTASGGTLNTTGAAGSRAYTTSIGGPGAGSMYGTGGIAATAGAGAGGGAAGFGAGGGGAIATTAGGGAGAPGLVIIWQTTP